MLLDDVRKAIEGMISTMTPAKAQEVARGMTEPGAAKEQVAKTAADLIEWSQRNRDRLREMIRHEIEHQMKTMGIATQADVDALKRRVRELERGAGMTASGAKRATRTQGSTARSSAASTAGSKPTTTSRAKPAAASRAKPAAASKTAARKRTAVRSATRSTATRGEGAQAPTNRSASSPNA